MGDGPCEDRSPKLSLWLAAHSSPAFLVARNTTAPAIGAEAHAGRPTRAGTMG
jgi:hypothetical protein